MAKYIQLKRKIEYKIEYKVEYEIRQLMRDLSEAFSAASTRQTVWKSTIFAFRHPERNPGSAFLTFWDSSLRSEWQLLRSLLSPLRIEETILGVFLR